jgi:hypothetical protein
VARSACIRARGILKAGPPWGSSRTASLDGFAVVQDYEQERHGSVTFRGHGVFWWDPAAQSYVLTWFDSMGLAPNEFRGRLEADVLTLTSQGPQGLSRAVFDLSDHGRYGFRMEVSGDGKEWQPLMEGSYERES